MLNMSLDDDLNDPYDEPSIFSHWFEFDEKPVMPGDEPSIFSHWFEFDEPPGEPYDEPNCQSHLAEDYVGTRRRNSKYK